MLLLLPLPVIEQIAAVFIISHQTCKQPNFPSVKCCRLGTRVCYVSLIPLKWGGKRVLQPCPQKKGGEGNRSIRQWKWFCSCPICIYIDSVPPCSTYFSASHHHLCPHFLYPVLPFLHNPASWCLACLPTCCWSSACSPCFSPSVPAPTSSSPTAAQTTTSRTAWPCPSSSRSASCPWPQTWPASRCRPCRLCREQFHRAGSACTRCRAWRFRRRRRPRRSRRGSQPARPGATRYTTPPPLAPQRWRITQTAVV